MIHSCTTDNYLWNQVGQDCQLIQININMNEYERQMSITSSRFSNLQASHSSSQHSELTLSVLRQRVQEVKQAIYDELSIKRDEAQGVVLLQKYQQANTILNKIQLEQKELAAKWEQASSKLAISETEQHKNDTKQLAGKLQERVELRESQTNNLKQLISLIKLFTINTRNAEISVKHGRLLEKSLSNLSQLKEDLKRQNDNQTMQRKLRLTKDDEDNQYIINLIKHEDRKHNVQAKEKLNILKEKIRASQIENQQLIKDHNNKEKQLHELKISQILAKANINTASKPIRVAKKAKKVEQTSKPITIAKPEPILTQIVTLPSNYKHQIRVGLVLLLATVLLLINQIVVNNRPGQAV